MSEFPVCLKFGKHRNPDVTVYASNGSMKSGFYAEFDSVNNPYQWNGPLPYFSDALFRAEDPNKVQLLLRRINSYPDPLRRYT